MMSFPKWKPATLCLACLGMVVPNGFGADQRTQSVARTDIRLSESGTLAGSVVNADGEVQSGVPVNVMFNGVRVASAKTNAAGRFAVTGLRGGVHEVATSEGRVASRFWTAAAAPKSAQSAVIVQAGQKIVRGQDDSDGYFTPSTALVGGLAVIAAIAGVAAWADSDSDDGVLPASP